MYDQTGNIPYTDTRHKRGMTFIDHEIPYPKPAVALDPSGPIAAFVVGGQQLW
jgi:hypothetical protein